MNITVSCKDIIPLLKTHLKGKRSVDVNFSFDNDKLIIQSSNSFILMTSLPFGTKFDSFSFMITNVIDIFINIESIVIHNLDEIVIFESSSISISFQKTPTEFIEVDNANFEYCCNIFNSVLSKIVFNSRVLTPVAESLYVGIPSIMIHGNNVFSCLSNSIMRTSITEVFPNIEIPYESIRNLLQISLNSYTKVSYDRDKSLLKLKCDNTIAIIHCKKVTESIITSYSNVMRTLTYIEEFNLSSLEGLDFIFKYYKNESITLTFYRNRVVSVQYVSTNNTSIKSGVQDIPTMFSIDLSTSQFLSLYKFLNGSYKTRVYRGNDLVCFEQDQSRLLFSGMIY